jgi:hypothetical protein
MPFEAPVMTATFSSLLMLVSFKTRSEPRGMVRTAQHIDGMDAGLCLPCTDLAHGAKMDSPSRSTCAEASGV